jgi:hypothetical protein
MTIKTITITTDLTTEEIVIISNEDGSETSMLKSTYDEMIAEREATTL